MSAVAREAPQGAQRCMQVVQVQGEGEGWTRRERGAERQVGQRRRWREGRDDRGGGFDVQFCGWFVSLGRVRDVWYRVETRQGGRGDVRGRLSSRIADSR